MNFNKELFSLIKAVKLNFYLLILTGILIAVATLALAFLLSNIINSVFLTNKTLPEVRSLLLGFLFVAVLKLLLQFLEGSFSSSVIAYVKTSVREKIVKQVFDIGPLLLKSEQTGELANTLIKGVDKLEEYFAKFLPQLFNALLIPILILIFVFPIDLLTAIIFVVTAPIIPLFMYLIGNAAQKLNNKQWQSLSRMSAYFFDVLIGLQTLKLFNKTNETVSKIFDVTNSFRIKTMNVLRVAFLSALVLEVAATISVAVVAVSIGLRLLSGNFNFQEALFILIIAPEFYLPMRKLGAGYHAGMEGVAAFERIKDFIPQEGTLISIPKSELASEKEFTAEYSLEIKNVSFTFPARDKPAIDDVSFTIEKNKITALVGLSGSGKSTIMNLLLRFFEPTKGTISIGNQNISEVNAEVWRKNISWVSQNPHVFNKSILENIKIANESATDEEVIEAARKARLHDRIMKLPQQYSSRLGEYGAKFSGGEVQRLAIARAHLRNSKILLVDEPTANLDPIIEEEILKDLFHLYEGKTTLVIAHRLNTIINADKIIVLKEGKLLDYDTHDNLISRDSYYKKMLESYYA
ncbi:MAG: thiol reductant ABC exporter subunit CydD [Melioribacteraceae bacterium]